MIGLHSRRLRRLPRWMLRMWPQWPLAMALVLAGAVNIVSSLRYSAIPLSEIGPLLSVSKSLGVLGRGAQLILGSGLALVGFGLLWRLATAWAFAVLLLTITIGVNLARHMYGASLVMPGLLLLLLVFFKSHFARRTALANYLISVIGIMAVLAYGTIGTYLLGADFKPQVRDITSAFYFTMVTLSTVGYGDITPTAPETRLFVVSLLVVGLSIFATAIVSALGPTISEELRRMFNPREPRMKPKDHVILVGDGPVACNTARELTHRGIAFVQIMQEGCDAPIPDQFVVHGDPDDDQVLDQAGIQDARMVIAAKEDDGENAFIALVAKDLNPRIQVLAVASTARSIRRLRLARADLVFAPAAVGGRLLANLVEGNEISPEFRDLLQKRASDESVLHARSQACTATPAGLVVFFSNPGVQYALNTCLEDSQCYVSSVCRIVGEFHTLIPVPLSGILAGIQPGTHGLRANEKTAGMTDRRSSIGTHQSKIDGAPVQRGGSS